MESTDYPTNAPDGMSFINNRWVFTGSSGYRVVKCDFDQGYDVVSYDGSQTRPVYLGQKLTEQAAHALAARLAGKST